MNKVLEWSKSHPWETGGLALIGGIAFLFLMGGHKGASSSSSSGPDANLSAYLAAETAQNASSNALTALQEQVHGATAQAGIAANEKIAVNHTWAASDLAMTENNNQTSTWNKLTDWFGAIANNNGTVLTDSSSSSSGSSGSAGLNVFGLFSLGGGGASQSSSGSSHQTLVANSQQANAEAELSQIANQQFHIGH